MTLPAVHMMSIQLLCYFAILTDGLITFVGTYLKDGFARKRKEQLIRSNSTAYSNMLLNNNLVFHIALP